MSRSPLRRVAAALTVLGALALGACGTTQEEGPEYQRGRPLPPLEVPPDLAAPETEGSLEVPAPGEDASARAATYSQYRPESRAGGARAAVLPEVPDITVRRDEQMRWLVMRAEPEAVWPKVRDFWIDQGFELTETNARVGVLQTDWAEDRAEIPAGGIGKLLGKLYSASFRDKYRTRLERGSSPGTTEIYVAHRGLREVITEGGGTETVQTGWETRPSDPGLEAEMLARLMVSLGAEDSKSQARERVAGAEPRPPRARLIDADGAPALELDERFARAWRITGLALDRGGFTVEDRNRDQGVYYVRYRPAPAAKRGGFLSSLAFWRDNAGQDEAKRYQIALVSAGEETRVVVREPSGERSASETARRILRLLHEELR